MLRVTGKKRRRHRRYVIARVHRLATRSACMSAPGRSLLKQPTQCEAPGSLRGFGISGPCPQKLLEGDPRDQVATTDAHTWNFAPLECGINLVPAQPEAFTHLLRADDITRGMIARRLRQLLRLAGKRVHPACRGASAVFHLAKSLCEHPASGLMGTNENSKSAERTVHRNHAEYSIRPRLSAIETKYIGCLITLNALLLEHSVTLLSRLARGQMCILTACALPFERGWTILHVKGNHPWRRACAPP